MAFAEPGQSAKETIATGTARRRAGVYDDWLHAEHIARYRKCGHGALIREKALREGVSEWFINGAMSKGYRR